MIAATPRLPRESRAGVSLRLLALLAAVAALACGSAGCGKKPPPKSEADERLFKDITATQLVADSVFSMRDTLKVDRGTWKTPDGSAAYEAYREGAIYRFIEEREDRGDRGGSANRYYYDPNGALFFYEDRGEEKEPRGSLPPMSRLVQRTLIFAPDGRPTWGRRLVDGVAGAVPDSQSAVIAERSRGILAHLKGMTP
ncbi:MAG TPA: hypothetical protein VFS09_08455 [Candidatus Eisenbacteria bacterium]|nr:hypothetical protein [Candidatus Eisenbacteria bacterium]